ncbi:MAG: hypothetical protein ABIX01_00035 [Chitinophagaceae bacterium]
MACPTYKKAILLRLVNIHLILNPKRSMYKLCSLLCFFVVTQAGAQYYYNDILGNQEAKDNFLLLKKNNIKKVTVTSTAPDGMPVEGLAILQEINARKNQMTTSTHNELNPTSILLTQYLTNGLPASTTDSTEAAVSATIYTYSDDGVGNLLSITSKTHEPEQSAIKFMEQRQYTFNGMKPSSMLRVKNGKDSLQVQFVNEEHGWIGEERWTEKGKATETYFYYYDVKGNLTDIARFNKKANRLLPDYTFEYDATGRITIMNSFVNGTNQYRIWRYTYDGRGLKTKEVVFNNKAKESEGKVVYSYE